MKKKHLRRISAALLLLFVAVTACACHKQSTPAPGSGHSRTGGDQPGPDGGDKREVPLLWRVEGGESTGTLYLFGSIHAADDSAYPLRQAVLDAYEASDVLAVEADTLVYELDVDQQMAATGKVAYADGTEISDHIDPGLYAAAVRLLKEDRVYSPLYDRYQPVLWIPLLEDIAIRRAGLNAQMGLDLYFLRRAKNEGREIVEVESMSEQMALLGSLSDTLQEEWLRSYVEEGGIDRAAVELAELYNRWKRGEDISAAVGIGDPALETEMEKALIADRNPSMTDAAEACLQEGGTTFFVVGAAHTGGSGGIAALLKSRGYTVTPC